MKTVLLAVLLAYGAADTSSFQQSYTAESQGDYDQAIDALAGLDRDYVVHLRLGWLYYLDGRHADAVDAYRAAIRLAPQSIEARQGLILPLMAARRWTEAEAACRDVLSLSEADYLGRSRLAYVLYSSGRYAEAATEYGRVLELYPSDVEMRAGLGWSRLKLGDKAGARAAFEEALRLSPDYETAQQGLALCE